MERDVMETEVGISPFHGETFIKAPESIERAGIRTCGAGDQERITFLKDGQIETMFEGCNR